MNKMDMTKGNIWKLILVFSVPLFIGNLVQLLYSLFDSMISSHLISQSALAAIGATSAVNSLIVSMSSGMGSGSSIIISQAFGGKNDSKIRNSIFNILVINTIVSLIVTVLIVIFIDVLLGALSVPSDIYAMAKEYFLVIIIGLITTLMYNTLSGILRSFGNSVVPLIVLTVSAIANIGGDFLFISVFHLGLAGSALSTILCQLLSALYLWFYLYRKYPEYRIEKKDIYFEKENVVSIVSTGLSMGIMNSIFSIGGIMMSKAINELGSDLISARTVGRRLIEICMLPETSLASACSVFVSQNYGAKDMDRAKKGIRITSVCVGIWCLIILLMLVFERPLAIMVAATGDKAVIDNAVLSMNIALPCFFPLGILLIIRMSLQSLGRKIIPILSSCVELLLKVISAIVWIPKYGFIGEAITEPISWVVCCLFVTAVYIYYLKKGVFLKK